MEKKKEKRRMIASDWEALSHLLTMSDERKEIARLSLVDGLTYQVIADRYGCSRQAVGDAISVAWRKHESYLAAQQAAAKSESGLIIPEGWEQVTLIAPSFLVAKFKNEIAELATWPPKKIRKTTKQ